MRLGLAVALIALLLFLRTVGFPFVVCDDYMHIVNNPELKTWGFLTKPYFGLYVPVTYAFWALIGKASSGAAAYHLGNVILHAFNAYQVYALLRRYTGSAAGAAAGALLFAVHPLQVEPVAWVSGAKDLVATAFGLGALRLCLAERRMLATGAFVLALLAKPSAVCLPAVAAVLLWEWKLPLVWAILAAPVVVIAKAVQPDYFSAIVAVPLWQRPVVAVDAIAFYARMLVVPLLYAVDYGRNPTTALAAPDLWQSFVLVGILALVAWKYRSKGALIALCALGPQLGLVPFAHQYYSTVADRYAYLAMLGPALIVAGWMQDAPARRWFALTTALVAAGCWTVLRQDVWRDSRRLFEQTLAVSPDSVLANIGLGYLNYEDRRFDEAAPPLERALELRPGDHAAMLNLANVYLMKNQIDQAVALYRENVEPGPNEADARAHLAQALLRQNHVPEGVEEGREAVRLAPDFAGGHAALGLGLFLAGDPAGAVMELSRALALNPGDADAAKQLDFAKRQLRAPIPAP